MRTFLTTIASIPKKLKPEVFPNLWPLPLWAVGFLYAFLPGYFFMGRGYTQWFMHCAFIFFLSRSEFFANFILLQGTTVVLGWYSALVYEYTVFGRLGHMLYWQMPSFIKDHIMDERLGEPKWTNMSILMMLVAHTLDFIAHPLLAYFFIRRFQKKHGFSCKSLSKELTWPVIFVAWALSRFWAAAHHYVENEDFSLFYFGYDVYLIKSAEPWYAAYASEQAFFALLIIWKLSYDYLIKPIAKNVKKRRKSKKKKRKQKRSVLRMKSL